MISHYCYLGWNNRFRLHIFDSSVIWGDGYRQGNKNKQKPTAMWAMPNTEPDTEFCTPVHDARHFLPVNLHPNAPVRCGWPVARDHWGYHRDVPRCWRCRSTPPGDATSHLGLKSWCRACPVGETTRPLGRHGKTKQLYYIYNYIYITIFIYITIYIIIYITVTKMKSHKTCAELLTPAQHPKLCRCTTSIQEDHKHQGFMITVSIHAIRW